MSADPQRPAVRRPTLPSFAGFGLALALVWLGGQFVRQGLSDELARTNPASAVLWMGGSPDALAALARQRLAARDASNAARLAANALRRAPLNAAALTTYGLAMQRLGQPQLSNRAMDLAGARGWRDVLTQIWLFRRDLLSSRFAPAFGHADALLRRENIPPPGAFQILALAVRDPRAIAPMADQLAANPPWRPGFLTYLALQARPPETDAAGVILSRLAASAAPPTDAEIGPYLNGLVRQRRFQDAMQAWRRLAPATAGSGEIHDGDFSRPPGATPFDWTLASGVGWTAVIDDSPGGPGKALNIQYDGVSPPQTLRQMLALTPGAYRLSGRFYDETGGAAAAFAWTVTCEGVLQPLVVAPASPGPARGWRAFSLDFGIPADACAAQWLALRGQPAEIQKDFSVWYTALAITRLAPAAPKPQPAS